MKKLRQDSVAANLPPYLRDGVDEMFCSGTTCEAVEEGVGEGGLVGALTGGIAGADGGIAAAIFLGLLVGLVARSGDKS